jgi:hypothetical protein
VRHRLDRPRDTIQHGGDILVVESALRRVTDVVGNDERLPVQLDGPIVPAEVEVDVSRVAELMRLRG